MNGFRKYMHQTHWIWGVDEVDGILVQYRIKWGATEEKYLCFYEEHDGLLVDKSYNYSGKYIGEHTNLNAAKKMCRDYEENRLKQCEVSGSRCPARDDVWSRQCTKDRNHVTATSAKERLHLADEIPGDTLTWGTVMDMRAVEKR